MRIYFGFLAALTGAVMGSFINCWALRYVTGEKYPRGRSRCPACGHTLGPMDLVPVLSWLILRGRCRYCGERISPRYPATELITSAAYLAAYLTCGFTLRTVQLMLLYPALLLLALVDLDTMELPTAPMVYAALIYAAFLPTAPDPLGTLKRAVITSLILFASLLIVSLIMDKLLNKDTLGGGDLKLLALSALYCSGMNAILLILTTCVIGFITMAAQKRQREAFPLGPAICAAVVICSLWGEEIVTAYMRLVM